ncbi:MAG TPA: MFS transporter [Gemmataceae bacterium]|jgi:predicted MFS family arabinose efflux permease|nr:MFS transporter [Gemmataceae bacterium]
MGEETENGTGPGRRRAAHHLTAREWLLLLILAAVQFTHTVDFMIIMPLGPVYMREMKLTADQFSHVVAAYTVAAGAAGLIASRILDRFGRKTALLTLYAGFVTGTLLCAIAPGYFALLAARTVTGAFGGVAAAVVLAVVGDVFPDVRRGAATGVVMSAFSVAMIAGVPLGLVLEEQYSWHVPFIALGGLGVAVLALAFVLLPPLRGHIGRHPVRTKAAWALFTEPNHLRAYTLMVAMMFGSFTISPLLATFLEFNVGLAHDRIKWIYVCGGLATILTLTPIGRLADEYGKLRVFRICAVATMLLIAAVTNLPAGLSLAAILLATTGLFIASSGRMVPAMAMITSSAALRDRGGFMSMNAAVQHLSAGLATVVAGAMVVGGQDKQPLAGFGLVGLVACVSTAVSVYLAGRLRPAPGGLLAPDVAEVEHMGETVEAIH